MSGTSTPILGIDFGGSSIKAGAVDVSTGAVLGELQSVPTPKPATPEAVVGALAGLAALAAPVAAALAAAVDAGTPDARPAQAQLIGLRQMLPEFHRRAAALRAAHATAPSPRVDARLHAIQTSLSVARGPRAIRMARLGQSMLPGHQDKPAALV